MPETNAEPRTHGSLVGSVLLSRFQVLRMLGSGGFGEVYEAVDTSRRARVALKRLMNRSATSLFRFKREFRALSDLVHPNLVTLYELFASSDIWFFTMELVNGLDVLSYVRASEALSLAQTVPAATLGGAVAGPPLDLQRLRASLSQLAEGVCALHERRRIHRDLKPSNILVSPDGKLRILDFGLVAELSEDGSHQSIDAIVGSPAYMAPEQARGDRLTAATDWYAVGVLMFEALTGRLPFEGDPVGILLRKQTGSAPDPRSIVPGAPADLSELCTRLLLRDSSERAGAADVLAVVSSDRPAPRASAVPPRHPSHAPLVGRDAEMNAFHEALTQSHAGVVTLHVVGPSGIGKTSLIRQCAEATARAGDAWVLRARCYEFEAVPYKALDGIADDLASRLRALPATEVAELLPRDAQALGRLFPVIESVPLFGTAPAIGQASGDEHDERRRGFGALRELLVRLTDRRRLVLWIDDLQWGDMDSISFFREVVARLDAPRLLVVLSYRSEDVESSEVLATVRGGLQDATWGDVREIVLEPLSSEATEDLARTLLSGSDAADPRVIASESGGSPLFVGELARFAVEGTGQLQDVSLDELLIERVHRLDPVARRLLEAIAIAGRPLPVEAALKAAHVGGHAPLSALRSAQLTRMRRAGDVEEVETAHDRLREVIVRRMPPHDREAWHERLARVLEGFAGVDPEVLAIHFRIAGDIATARRYAMSAAENATRALAFVRAAQLYQLALELTEGSSDEAHATRLALAAALDRAGRGRQASEVYRAAADEVSGPERMALTGKAAEQLIFTGQIDEGIDAATPLLAQFGIRLPRTVLWTLVRLLVMRVFVILRGLGFHARAASEVPPMDLARVDLCESLGSGLALVATLKGAYFQARTVILALQLGEPRRACRALALEAHFWGTLGPAGARRAAKLLVRAREIAGDVGTDWEYAIIDASYGMSAFFSGRWREARQSFDRALTSFRGAPISPFHGGSITVFALLSLQYVGDLRELSDRHASFLREASERGDRLFGTTVRTGLNFVWLVRDDPAGAREALTRAMARWSRRDFHVQHWFEMLASGQIDLYTGETRETLARLDERWPALEQSLLLQIPFARLEAMWVRARVALAEARGDRLRPMLASCERDAGRVRGVRLPCSLPVSSLLLGGIAATRRDAAAARRHLEDALNGFVACDMPMHAAVARDRLGGMLGGSRGQSMRDEAAAWMKQAAVVAPDRLCRMMAPGYGANL